MVTAFMCLFASDSNRRCRLLLASVLLVIVLPQLHLALAQEKVRANQLMVAARKGQTDAVEKLLNKGVDVNARDKFGFTALVYAARSANPGTVKLLLARGADPNIKSKIVGYTPLMNAAAFGDVEAIGALLDSGAELNARTDEGATALTYAEQKGKSEAVNFLLKRGALK